MRALAIASNSETFSGSTARVMARGLYGKREAGRGAGDLTWDAARDPRIDALREADLLLLGGALNRIDREYEAGKLHFLPGLFAPVHVNGRIRVGLARGGVVVPGRRAEL